MSGAVHPEGVRLTPGVGTGAGNAEHTTALQRCFSGGCRSCLGHSFTFCHRCLRSEQQDVEVVPLSVDKTVVNLEMLKHHYSLLGCSLVFFWNFYVVELQL